jgi:hypothetical protein
VPHAIEPNGALEVSTGANDDTGEGAEDDDDPFSKRRYQFRTPLKLFVMDTY